MTLKEKAEKHDDLQDKAVCIDGCIKKKKSFTVVQISPEYLWARSPPETDPLIKLINNR